VHLHNALTNILDSLDASTGSAAEPVPATASVAAPVEGQ
jgi:hypothetical protein